MPLPNMPKVPRAPQESMAITIAGFLSKGIGAAALVTMMRLDSKGRALLEQAAVLTNAAELIDPFEKDPASWRHLEQHGRAKLEAFAADFIKHAKG